YIQKKSWFLTLLKLWCHFYQAEPQRINKLFLSNQYVVQLWGDSLFFPSLITDLIFNLKLMQYRS
ncbi:hypothetical protein DZI69_23090, partial [Escherichia coli]|nr:hypothetical protein [Escherichia coli]